MTEVKRFSVSLHQGFSHTVAGILAHSLHADLL